MKPAPELTLAMRAHNAAKYIGGAIESILRQTGVHFELIVVDDGSTDSSAKVVRSFDDPRISLIGSEQERGAGACHNLALLHSASQFFATVDADGINRPSSVSKLLDACASRSTTGMAVSYYFEIDEDGKQASRDAFRNQRAIFQQCLMPQTNYKETLLRYGDVASRFRVYARRALEAVGGFNESSRADAGYDIALKIADRFEVALLSEYLYCQRIRPGLVKSKHRQPTAWPRRWISRWSKNAQVFAETSLYPFVVQRLASRPFDLSSSVARPLADKRIAYYTWRFPVLSQTFINRELAALKQSGLTLEIIADEPEAIELADENAKSLLGVVTYLDPFDESALRRYHRHFFRRRRMEYLRLFFFVVATHYGPEKTVEEDMKVFSRTVYLAGLLKDRRIDHLHAPWSDRCAFVAMLAARLAGAGYSVQARAHDIHRKSYLFALQEKFKPAHFVLTNTRYNETHMKTFLDRSQWPKLFVIHNGVDLHRFAPGKPDVNPSAETKLLCVARLIEPKGLTYLLEACADLRSRGYSFRCEIVGGTEDIYMNYYLELKRLHKRLRLEKEVRFAGALAFKEVLKKYGETDIFVLPCVIAADGTRDITPNALIEAMAMKLPVISTTSGGIPEIVEHGVSGILVPPNDAPALADALVRLIDDPELRRRMGESAREKIESKFDINKNIQRYIELFSEGRAADRNQRVLSTTGGHN